MSWPATPWCTPCCGACTTSDRQLTRDRRVLAAMGARPRPVAPFNLSSGYAEGRRDGAAISPLPDCSGGPGALRDRVAARAAWTLGWHERTGLARRPEQILGLGAQFGLPRLGPGS